MLTNLFLVILFIFDFSLIYMIYFYNPTGTINRFLTLLIVPIMLSNIEMLLLRTVVSSISIDIGLNMAFLGGLAFFPIFFHFSYYYPRKTMNRKRLRQVSFVYFETLAIGIALFLTYLLKPQAVKQTDVWHIVSFFKTNPAFFSFYLIMFIYQAFLLGATIRRFLKSYRMNLMSAEKRNIVMLLAGFIPTSMLMIFSYFIFLPLRQGMKIYLFVSAFYTVYFIILLLSFGYLDRRAVVRTLLTYPTAVVIILLLFKYVLAGVNDYICTITTFDPQLIIASEVLLLFLLLQPLLRLFESRLNGHGGSGSGGFHNSLRHFAGGLSGIITLAELSAYLDSLFYGKLNITGYYLMVKSEDGREYVSAAGQGACEFRFPADGELAGKLEGYRRIMNIQQMSLAWHEGDELQILYENRVVLISPLFDGQELTGFIMFGEPGPARAWYPSEVEELEIFLSGVPVAIARCSMHEKAIALEKKQASIEKMAVLSEISSGIAHEIRNPLSIISASAETMAVRELDGEEVRRFASYIQDETERMSRLLNRILSISVNSEARHRPVNVVTVIRRALDLISSKLRKKNLDADFRPDSRAVIAVIDNEVLMQICLNLILNAIDAMSPGMVLGVTAGYTEAARVLISFENQGKFIPADVLARVFDPFFTTKKNGTGLGLSISQRLVKEAGGEIRVKSDAEGTVFQIYLPASVQSM